MTEYIFRGDCLDILDNIEENSLDALVTDPPYGLGTIKNFEGLIQDWLNDGHGLDHVGPSGFLNKSWDATVPPPKLWKKVFRVLKPGAHGFVFAGTRTHDLMGLSLRLSGFEIIGSIAWVNPQGFPKGGDVSKLIDKKLNAKREIIAENTRHGGGKTPMYNGGIGSEPGFITLPATEESRIWDGYRSQIKPGYEPILIVRKPLDGTIADNAMKWHCGAFNIDDCRIPSENETSWKGSSSSFFDYESNLENYIQKKTSGRFPTDFILTHDIDCTEKSCTEFCPVKRIGNASGFSKSKANKKSDNRSGGQRLFNLKHLGRRDPFNSYDDEGTASRFFWKCYPDDNFIYMNKSTQNERNHNGKIKNNHPTVKPIELIKYLCKLINPPYKNSVILDPFAGSGTTGVACKTMNINCILIEREEEYVDLIEKRLYYTDIKNPLPGF